MFVYYTAQEAGQGICQMIASDDMLQRVIDLIPGKCYKATGMQAKVAGITRVVRSTRLIPIVDASPPIDMHMGVVSELKSNMKSRNSLFALYAVYALVE